MGGPGQCRELPVGLGREKNQKVRCGSDPGKEGGGAGPPLEQGQDRKPGGLHSQETAECGLSFLDLGQW